MTESAKWSTVAWVVVAVIACWAGMRMLRPSDPAPAPVRVEGRPSVGRAAGHGSGRSRVYVHVAGAVRRPGLLRVPSGARVAAAIDRAGGPGRGADLTAINLAQPLEDGQQVIVPQRGSARTAAGAPGGPAAGAAPAVTTSLATATLEQLDALDGIGPTLAKRILEYRAANGRFRSIAELREVDGIGEKRFAVLRKSLRP